MRENQMEFTNTMIKQSQMKSVKHLYPPTWFKVSSVFFQQKKINLYRFGITWGWLKDHLNDHFRFLVELKSVCFTQGNVSSLLQSTSKVAGGKRLFSRSHVNEHVIKDMSLQEWGQMSLQEIMIHDASSTGCRLHVVLVMRKLELDNSQHTW